MDEVLAMPGADRPIPERVAALGAAGGLHYWSSDQAGSARLYQEQINVAREVGDAHGIADGMFNAAHSIGLLGDTARSIELSREAEQRYLELGDRRAAERTRIVEGMGLQALGDPAAAYAIISAQVGRYREHDDVFYLGLAIGVLAGLAMVLGRPREGVLSAIEGVEVSRMLGDVASLAIGLGNFAIIGELLGRDDVAVTIDAAFNALCDRYGVRPPGGLGLLPGVPESGANARARLGEEAAARAAAVGRAMTLDEALDYSVALMRAAAEVLPEGAPPPA
jgi:hypothetical protein